MDHCNESSRLVGPEDLTPGDYVTVAHVTLELLPLCDDEPWRHAGQDLQPQRITFMAPSAGLPLKVQAVCYPFVLVRTPAGDAVTLDLRRHRLARLSETYARKAVKCITKKRGQS